MTHDELCHYIGKRVQTPRGKGRLDQVLDANHIRVFMDSERKKSKNEQRNLTFKEHEIQLLVERKP